MNEQVLDTKEYQSDAIDLQVAVKPFCRVSMTVKVKPSIMQSSKKKALREISKEVSLPGFRKGKVPLDWIEKKYPEAVTQGWDKALADETFVEAQKISHIHPLQGNARISYKVSKLTDTEGEISFDFESEPMISEIPLANLSVKKVEEEKIDHARIDETIKTIQMFYAKWNQVEDRPIQEGDFVVLDIDDMEASPPIQAFSDSRFEVNRKTMALWMHDLIVGKNKGDVVEGLSVANPEDSQEIKDQFQQKKVKIHIKAVEEAVLPPVDQDFAKKLGVSDVDTLMVRLKDLLTKQAHEKAQTERREAIGDALVESVHFDLPASLLEKEANHRMNSLLKEPGFAKEWNETMTQEQKDAKKQEITQNAKKALLLFYICRKIILDNHIHLSPEEFFPSYDSLIDVMFADPARVHLKNQSKEQQAVEYSRFLITKAQDFIIEKLGHSTH